MRRYPRQDDQGDFGYFRLPSLRALALTRMPPCCPLRSTGSPWASVEEQQGVRLDDDGVIVRPPNEGIASDCEVRRKPEKSGRGRTGAEV